MADFVACRLAVVWRGGYLFFLIEALQPHGQSAALDLKAAQSGFVACALRGSSERGEEARSSLARQQTAFDN